MYGDRILRDRSVSGLFFTFLKCRSSAVLPFCKISRLYSNSANDLLESVKFCQVLQVAKREAIVIGLSGHIVTYIRGLNWLIFFAKDRAHGKIITGGQGDMPPHTNS